MSGQDLLEFRGVTVQPSGSIRFLFIFLKKSLTSGWGAFLREAGWALVVEVVMTGWSTGGEFCRYRLGSMAILATGCEFGCTYTVVH